MGTCIYVGNLAKSTTEAALKPLFSQARAAGAVNLVKDRDNGQLKGSAFVTISESAEAEKAISMFNAYSLIGHEQKVNVAKPKVTRT